MKLKTHHLLLLILLAALILRIPNIAAPISGDEVDTVGPAKNFIISGQTFEYEFCNGTKYYNNAHPPFRIAFYSLWAVAFGFGTVAMRFVPLLFGLATIALTFLLGKELYSEKAGLAAAAIAAVSRYHIFASQLVSNDNTLFIFLFEAALYFFLLYKKRKENRYAVLTFAFALVSLYAKITFILLIPAMIVYSLMYDKKNLRKDIFLIAGAVLFFVASLYAISFAANDGSIFSIPLGALPLTAASHSTFDISTKIFYAATVTWQLTPFLLMLIILALYKGKKDRNYWFLATWIVLPFLAFIAGSGDIQRYYTISLPAIFVLLGKFLENVNPKKKEILVSAIFIFALAFILGLDDIMGYLNPSYIAIFYLAAFVFLLHPKRQLLLLGAATGLAIYFAFSPGFVVTEGAQAVKLMVEKTSEMNVPYNNVLTTKDINFYMTPSNETARFCEYTDSPSEADYIAMYNLPDEKVVDNISRLCDKPGFVEYGGRRIGVVCKIKR